MKRLSISVLVILAVTAAFVTQARSRSTAQTSFENIKVLTDMSDADIRNEMNLWSEALGESCNYCHKANCALCHRGAAVPAP
jgi:hypothetical protein